MVKKKTEEKSLEKKPSWIKMKKEDLEEIVVRLAESGKTPRQIGLELRDKHGIPKTKLFGVKISKILKNKKIEYEKEREIIKKRIEKLRRHIEKNKKDYPASRALTKKLWVVRD